MNKTAKVIISILVIYIISLLSFSGCNGKTKIVEIEKTDTIQIFDTAYIQQLPETILINKPIPTYITEVRVDTVKEETILVTENKLYNDTICNQNDSIILKSSISGVNASLDYTQVDWRKQDKVITNTITVTKFIKDKKRLAFGIQAGYGYGFKNKELTPYIGFGLTFKL